jgi:hypothetical protein
MLQDDDIMGFQLDLFFRYQDIKLGVRLIEIVKGDRFNILNGADEHPVDS